MVIYFSRIKLPHLAEEGETSCVEIKSGAIAPFTRPTLQWADNQFEFRVTIVGRENLQ